MAMKRPERYVLKPQREGGGNVHYFMLIHSVKYNIIYNKFVYFDLLFVGNNHFGEEIRNILADVKDSAERSAYVLMDRIYPAPIKNYALRSDCEPVYGMMVSELGILGIIVG